jgi:hypothetical protein
LWVVRLAREQGLLKGRDLSPIQRFALAYAMNEDRKDAIQLDDRRFREQLFIHKPEVLKAIEDAEKPDWGDGSGEEGYEPDNIEKIEAYLQQIETPKTASAMDDEAGDWI